MTAQHVAVTVDEDRGWRVIHPSPLSSGGLFFIVFFGGGAVTAFGAGLSELVKYANIGGLLIALAMSACFLSGIYTLLIGYFVAFDKRFVVQGRRRSAPRQVILRSDVARARWAGAYRSSGGQLLDRDGKVLIAFEALVTRKQLMSIARELGVPFSG